MLAGRLQGYLHVQELLARLVMHVQKEPYEPVEHTNLVLATAENMAEPDVARLLRPDLSILGK